VTPRWRWGDDVAVLAELLDRGGILAIPTESSYGLGVDPRRRPGVESVYKIKGRSRQMALPVVVAGIQQLPEVGVDLDEPALVLLRELWPAPLTAVLPCRPGLPAAAGGDTVAVRIPAAPDLVCLLDRLQRPLTATSANLGGGRAVRDPDELETLLEGSDAVVVDGGVLPGGPPSTIVELAADGWKLLREGRFPFERLPAASVVMEVAE